MQIWLLVSELFLKTFWPLVRYLPAINANGAIKCAADIQMIDGLSTNFASPNIQKSTVCKIITSYLVAKNVRWTGCDLSSKNLRQPFVAFWIKYLNNDYHINLQHSQPIQTFWLHHENFFHRPTAYRRQPIAFRQVYHYRSHMDR